MRKFPAYRAVLEFPLCLKTKFSRYFQIILGKDTSRSPSRPQSSMSGASELSATSSSISAVNMRTRSAPRRPRPYSIAGSIVDRTPPVAAPRKELERQPRLQEKNGLCYTVI